jgi:hypothetical protein
MNFKLSLLIVASLSSTAFCQDSLKDAASAADSIVRKAQALGKRIGRRPVQAPGDGWWETGYILAQPVKASQKGLMFNTWEVSIMAGQFADDAKYVGTERHLSIESSHAHLVDVFNKLDRSRNYVFKYKRVHPFNPEIESTGTHIIDIQEPLPPASQGSVESDIGRQGTYSNDGSRQGRIMWVERWGRGSTVCSFAVNHGGLVTSSDKSQANVSEFAIYSEEGCVMAEELVRRQAEVEVAYSEDAIEIWDLESKVAQRLSVLAKRKAGSSKSKSDAPDAYEAIKQQLLRDPDFIREIKKKLAPQS